MTSSGFSISSWNHLNYMYDISNHGIYFDRRSYDQSSNTYVYEHPYTIDINTHDLKQPDIVANHTNLHKIGDMDTLQCKDLARCNQFVYFIYDDEAVVDTGIHPFM